MYTYFYFYSFLFIGNRFLDLRLFYIPIDIFVIHKLLSSICFTSKSFCSFNFKRSYLFLANFVKIRVFFLLLFWSSNTPCNLL